MGPSENCTYTRQSVHMNRMVLNVQSPYKRGGNVTGNSYFYTFCTFLTFGALPVVKDAQTKWHPCNGTTAKC